MEFIANRKLINIPSKSDATKILDTLLNIAKAYKRASVADLKDCCDITAEYGDNKYYWTYSDIQSADLFHEDGCWNIRFPTPVKDGYTPPASTKVVYREYSPPKPTSRIKPTLTIAIDYAGVDDDFDNVLAKAVQYAQTITDREVKIDIC